MECALELQHLCKAYGDFALKDLTLSVPKGTILGLVGENGAGKSTTIKLIINAITQDSGEALVLGTNTRSSAFRAVKEKIGVVLDEAHFPVLLTPNNVNTVLQHTYQNWDSACYFSYLDRFQLPRKKAFEKFSRGMRMKLAFAVALSHGAELLVLDEATGGLDPFVRDEILDLLNDFTRDENHAVLLSSHIVSDLEKICDTIAFLHQGKLEFWEEKDRLQETYALLRVGGDVLADVPPAAIVGKRDTGYGVDLLVKKAEISKGFSTECIGIEEMIVMLVKGK